MNTAHHKHGSAGFPAFKVIDVGIAGGVLQCGKVSAQFADPGDTRTLNHRFTLMQFLEIPSEYAGQEQRCGQKDQ